jgi:hypothetical protein
VHTGSVHVEVGPSASSTMAITDGGRAPSIADDGVRSRGTRSIGPVRTHDDGIDLHELARVAERVSAEQRRGRDVVVEPRPDRAPRSAELIALTHDMDGEMTDIRHGEAMCADQRAQIGEAGCGLLGRLVHSDEGSARVVRDLTGHEQLITDLVGVSVSRSLRQPGGDLAFVHDVEGIPRAVRHAV